MEHPNMQGKLCKCPHHKMLPALVALGGFFWLLGTLSVFTMGFVNVAVALLVIIGGLSSVFEGGCKCC